MNIKRCICLGLLFSLGCSLSNFRFTYEHTYPLFLCNIILFLCVLVVYCFSQQDLKNDIIKQLSYLSLSCLFYLLSYFVSYHYNNLAVGICASNIMYIGYWLTEQYQNSQFSI